nr:gibberellin 20-oxidase-like protein [Ipomoea batatas]
MQEPIQLPVLDISQPLNPHSLSALASACKDWGFFHVSNHGISKHLYEKIHSLSNNLFNLPPDTKLKLGPFASLRTYTPHFIASPFFESLKVSGPDFLSSAQTSVDVLLEYGSKMTELSTLIMKTVLMSLGESFEKKYYDSEFSNCHGYLRINNYTPPESLEGEVEGLGMHTDMSCITIAYQDEVGGLQAWSNERFRSSEHRVVLKKLVNRFSLAFFWCFEDEKVISAPDEVVGKGNTRFYSPFVCSQYVKFRENDEKGKFEKIGFTVKDYAGLMMDFLT